MKAFIYDLVYPIRNTPLTGIMLYSMVLTYTWFVICAVYEKAMYDTWTSEFGWLMLLTLPFLIAVSKMMKYIESKNNK